MRRFTIPVTGSGESLSSSGTNSPPLPSTSRGQGHDHSLRASTNNNGPRPLPHQSEESGAMQDRRWRLFEERVRTGPHGLTRFPSYPHSPIRILVIDDGVAHMGNPGLQQFIRDSPPRVRGQWHTGFTPQGEEIGLTEEEFKKAMSKLRKHVFSPTYPRRKAWKRGLFSTSHNTTTTTQEEDEDDDEGRECTICLDAFVPNQQVLLTPCNHMFHSECIVPWVKGHGKCPVCRRALVERRENPVSTNSNNIIGTDGEVLEIVALMRAMQEAFQWITDGR